MWLIDLVYADRDCKSPNMALLAATSRTLGGFWATTRTSPTGSAAAPSTRVRARIAISGTGSITVLTGCPTLSGRCARWPTSPSMYRPARSSPVGASSSRRSRHAGSRPRLSVRSPNHGPAGAWLCHPGQDRLLRHTDRPLCHHKPTQGPVHHGPQRRPNSRQEVGNRPRRRIRPEPAENLQEVNKRKRAPGNNTRVHKSWLLRHRHLIKPGRFLHGKKYPRS